MLGYYIMVVVKLSKRDRDLIKAKVSRGRATGAIKMFRKSNYPKGKRGRKYNKKYAPSQAFMTQMKKYNKLNAESKFFPMLNFQNGPASQGYLGEIPAVTLPSWGPGAVADQVGLSALVIQTGQYLTTNNANANTSLGKDLCYAVDGYSTTQGNKSNQIQGDYCNLKSSFIRININVDPAAGGFTSADYQTKCLPRQFRLIQVKAKRDNSVAPGGASADNLGAYTGNIHTNLFINELNQERGLLSQGSVADPFTWLINKSKFYCLRDERFTLTPNAVTAYSSGSNLALNNAVGPNGTTSKSQRFKTYYLPVPKNKRTKYDFGDDGTDTSQPLSFNFIVQTILVCKSMGGSGVPNSSGWNIQCCGMTSAYDL